MVKPFDIVCACLVDDSRVVTGLPMLNVLVLCLNELFIISDLLALHFLVNIINRYATGRS